MSLNGLDDPKIKEAYDTAVAEPGGWFLLKYTSRDEVDLLGRGNGGIVEIRNAIAKYEEPSPLFGFLRYRRRNVVIKYVPEECSRLVQARVTVHFNAVTERFSPHDTVFPITTSKELRDTTLSAACSLHTASGSTSSSTSSLRRRRLMEIAEEAEEDIRAKRKSTVPEERPSTGKTHSVSESQVASSPPPALPTGPSSVTGYQSFSADSSAFSPAKSTSINHTEIRPRSPTRSVGGELRRSSQSTRPDLHSYTSYGSSGRPKVKLGPRPSLDVGGRPHTSAASTYYRPVSTLPAGLKLFSRVPTKKERTRPKSQYESETSTMNLSQPPETPGLSAYMHQDSLGRPYPAGARPTTSSGVSIRPPMASPALSMAPTLPGLTPQRERLMRAQELRKKKMEAAVVAKEKADAEAAEAAEADEEAEKCDMPEIAPESQAPTDIQPTLAMINDMAKAHEVDTSYNASSTLKTDESDATRSDSYPVSPVCASERAESTKASSISESTDETIQDRKPFSPVFHEDISAKQTSPPTEDDREAFSPVFHEEAPTQEASEDEGMPLDQETHVQAPSADTPIQEPELPLLLPTTYTPIAARSPAFETPATLKRSVAEPDLARSLEEENDSNPQEAETIAHENEDSTLSTIAPEAETSATKAHVEEATPEPTPVALREIQNSKKETKEWNIPRSKFSVQNLKEAYAAPEVPSEPLPVSTTGQELVVAQNSPVESNFSVETRATNDAEGLDSGTSSVQRRKRKGAVEPIRTDLESDGFSSDDDFMDELQSAVVQEAKPIQVSKSPLSPIFPNTEGAKSNEPSRFARAFSNPLRKQSTRSNHLEPPTSSQLVATPRSVSASSAYLNRINSEPNKPTAKKVNLGSGISQRIKALEKFSTLSPDPTANASPTPASSAFFSVGKKNSVRGSTKSPSIAERANSLTGNTPSPSASASRESTPETLRIRDRSPSFQSRVNAFKSNGVPQSQPDTVSVTARIVRNASQQSLSPSDAGNDSYEFSSLNLRQSPLSVEHYQAENSKETLQERRLSRERRLSTSSVTPKKERRSSITIIKDLISERRSSVNEHRRSVTLDRSAPTPPMKSPSRPPSTHITNGHQKQVSIGSRMSSSSRDNLVSPPLTSANSMMSVSSGEEKEKKSGRAGRILSRMSRSIANAISPTVREELEPANGNGELGSPRSGMASPTSISISDVNVQFPDTLLWKRRSMFLDSQGYLIMAPALTAHANKEKAGAGATRRFHLSEFKTPCIPDVDAQELPNSVVLDFIEGGGLQVACEDRAGQGQILTILMDAHRNFAAYGQ